MKHSGLKNRMYSQAVKLTKPVCLIGAALILTGCTTSRPASVQGLRQVIGNTVPGAAGKTLADQYRIDEHVARSCAGGVYHSEECKTHTAASALRLKELRAASVR